jgi:eukaryotic-like serine/threonine-protein kinase
MSSPSHLDPYSLSGDPRVVDAVKQYMELIETGTAPSCHEYCEQHLDIAEFLKPCIEGLAMVQQSIKRNGTDLTAVHAPPSISPHEINSLAISKESPVALGDFQILSELGRGGMGIVYEAKQLSLGRRVALKVLSFAGGMDDIRLQRFRNEAQAAAHLHHTHIVPVYAVGVERGVHYYAMQLIEGQSLAQVIESMRNSRGSSTSSNWSAPSNRSDRDSRFRTIARVIVQAAQGLEHAHQYGVVHRDIKPANLMLDQVGNVWITDFGLAQFHTDSNLTRTGDMLGTLRYMSPEQSTGGAAPIDHRTDVYSLGATMYELLALKPAITATGYKDMLNQIADEDPIPLSAIDRLIPIELAIIASKALSKNPVDRYQSASQMADDLQRWLDDKPILAKPPTWLQRCTKWTKRHTGIVVSAGAFAGLGAVGLLISTLLLSQAQRQTAHALKEERLQRIAAEASFQNAKRAVDTFSEISEAEFATRPDLQSIRREFLETSLDFYRDFLEQRENDLSLNLELTATAERVEGLIESLQRLARLEPLSLLAYDPVQRELDLTQEQAQSIIAGLIAEDVGGSNGTSSIDQRLDQLFAPLSDGQWKRLQEIHRQASLPFTFKTFEVAHALGLSSAQRKEIGAIIQEERPDLAAIKKDGPNRDPRRSPHGPPGPPPFGRSLDPSRAPGPHSRSKLVPGSDEGPERGPGAPFDPSELSFIEKQTAKTVQRIIGLLTEDQRIQWDALRGEPFVARSK